MDFILNLPQTSGLKSGEEQGKVFDLAILGGGPAGMTAAVYALRKELDLVLISPDLGGQVQWTSGVENYLGYQYITGPELAQKFSSQVQLFPVKLVVGESAVHAEQAGDEFTVQTDGGREVRSRALILATGKRPRKLDVPGEREYVGRGVSYCSVCDGPFFKGLPVVVAGGGNSAMTSVLDMIHQGSPVTAINVADGWQADPLLMDRVRGKAALLDAHRVIAVEGDGAKMSGVKVAPRDGGKETLIPARGLFVEIGLCPNTGLFEALVDRNARGEILTDCGTRTSRPGVFAAGDCTAVPDKQIIIAAGDGAKAALAAYRFLQKIPA